VQASTEHDHVKVDFSNKMEEKELEHLREANLALIDRIKSEKEVSEKELE